MTVSALVVRIQHNVLGLFHRFQVYDSDNFAIRFSYSMAGQLDAGESLSRSIECALNSTRTTLFRANRLKKQEFVNSLRESLGPVLDVSASSSVLHHLKEFARHAESQLARALKRNRDEEFVRSNLEMFLLARNISCRRESHEGAGQTDIIVRIRGSDTDDLVEAKVPKTSVEFEDGLIETAQYAQSMRLDTAYYVVVDHCTDLNSPRFLRQATEVRLVDRVRVVCVRVRVSENSPSKVGRGRRKSASSSK